MTRHPSARPALPRRTAFAAHVLCASLAVGTVAALPQGALAQPAATEAARSIAIPAGPLGTALNRLGRESGTLITFAPELVAGLQTPGASGTLTVAQALQALLAGTGLEPVASAPGTFALRRTPEAGKAPASQGTATLSEVRVVAAAERTTTEGTGTYAATHLVSSTATPLGLSIQETPQSISVVTRQRLDDQAIVNVREALAQAPGIAFSDIGTERYSVMSRGYAVTSYQLDGVPTYLDMSTQTVSQSLSDLAIYDRVEVLRGSAGLAVGAGDPSGTLNFIRKRPTTQFQGYASAGIGSWNQRRAEVDVSGPLNAANTLRGRAVAAYMEGDSHLDYYEQNKQMLYGVLEADLTDSTTLTAGIDYLLNNPRGTQASGFPLFYSNGERIPFSRSVNLTSRYNTNRTEAVNAFAALKQNLSGGWTAEATVNQMHSTRHFSGVEFGTANSANATVNPTTGLGRLLTNAGDVTQEQTGINVKLSGPFHLLGRTHQLSAGAHYNDYTDQSDYASVYTANALNVFTWDHLGTADSISSYNRDSDTRVRQKGVYAAGRFELADAWRLIVGGRYGSYRSHYGYALNSPTYTLETVQEKSGFFTPYAGLTYELNRQHTLYGSYTVSYQPQEYRDRNGAYLQPREGNNYELGIKSNWLAGRLTSAVALYQIVQDNLAQVDPGYIVPGTNNTSAYVGVQGAKTRGFEAEVNGEVAQGWNLSAGYTYSETKNADGERITTTYPKHLVKLWTTYRLPGTWNRLTLGGGVNWQSEISLTTTPWWSSQTLSARQGAYAVTHLTARYDFTPRLTGTLQINNLFDRTYLSSIDSTFLSGVYGTPRNVALNLKYRF